MRRESLKQALKIIATGRRNSVWALVGCPDGGWGETMQAWRRVGDDLPHRTERSYTVVQLVEALYVLDHADRYRPREEE
jgi:hypothetical protein